MNKIILSSKPERLVLQKKIQLKFLHIQQAFLPLITIDTFVGTAEGIKIGFVFQTYVEWQISGE